MAALRITIEIYYHFIYFDRFRIFIETELPFSGYINHKHKLKIVQVYAPITAFNIEEIITFYEYL